MDRFASGAISSGMVALVDRLLRHRVESDPAPQEAVEAAVRGCIESARAAWPEVGLDDEDFVDALAERLPAGDPAAGLASLCASDVYLARACARGDRRAIAVFERHFAPELAGAFRGFEARAQDVGDLRQVLLERLFVATDGHPPKIAEYRGQGSLRAWLKVVAVRLRIDRQRTRGERPERFVDPEVAVLEVAESPDLRYLKLHYREQFRAAFVAALGLLDPRQRALLRLVAVEGLSATDIGHMYKVHRATSKRWLADARAQLFANTQRLLGEQLGTGVDVASIVALIRSQLDVSLARHLADENHAPPPE
jgi:RNA polymerase sigma-70 factor (ECF subfamily)